VENERTGRIAIDIAHGGRFTGRITLLGRAYPIRGHFDDSGSARFGAAASPSFALHARGLPALELILQVDVAGQTDKLTGFLTENGAPFAVISGDRARFTAAITAAPPFVHVPSAWRGAYTVVFAAKTPAEQGLAADRFPQGDGVARLTLNRAGVARLAGTLADGTPVSCAAPVAVGGEWPFYVSFAGGAGSISGPVLIRDRPATSDLDGLDLLWFKPAGSRARYPQGWPQGIRTDLLGAKYAGHGFEGLTAADSDGNAQITLSAADLASDVLKAASISSAPKLRVVQPGADRLSLSLDRVTGVIAGSYDPAGAPGATRVHAVFFPKQSAAFGYFRHGPGSGQITITPADHPVTSP
jgi:hypothetical protein